PGPSAGLLPGWAGVNAGLLSRSPTSKPQQPTHEQVRVLKVGRRTSLAGSSGDFLIENDILLFPLFCVVFRLCLSSGLFPIPDRRKAQAQTRLRRYRIPDVLHSAPWCDNLA